MAPCSTIHRPPARCHHRSAPCRTVKPNDQNVSPAARYHVAAVRRSGGRSGTLAKEAVDVGGVALRAALVTRPPRPRATRVRMPLREPVEVVQVNLGREQASASSARSPLACQLSRPLVDLSAAGVTAVERQ